MGRLTRVLCAALALMTAAGLCAGCAGAAGDGGRETYSIESELKRVYGWDTAFETTVTLTGYAWADGVSEKDVSLTQAFAGMAVERVERLSDTKLRVVARGEPADAEQYAYAAGTVVFTMDAVVDPAAEDRRRGEEAAQVRDAAPEEASHAGYAVDIPVARPMAGVGIVNTGGTAAVLTVDLTDCAFTGEVHAGSFTFEGAQGAPAVSSVMRRDADTVELTLAGDAGGTDGLYAALCDAALCVAGDALDTGRELRAPIASHDAALSAAVDYVEETGEGTVATILLSCSNGTLTALDAKNITLLGDLQAPFSLKAVDASTAELRVAVGGASTPDGLTIEGGVRIAGQWGETLWGTARGDADLTVRYTAREDSKELLAVETDLMFDLLKTGFTALATSIGKAAGGRLMQAIDSDLFADETVKKLSEMNKYLQKMDAKWTDILSRLDAGLAVMEDKIGSNNCSRALDEYDALAGTLYATVMHLDNRKAAVDAAQPGTPEYEAAANAFVGAVDREPCKVYTNAYVLGQRMLKGSAGLSKGIVGTYDEMLSLIYNFDVQTYGLKEEFRVLALALYLKAYDQAALYYQLTEPDNDLLAQLQTQLVSIGKLLDGMRVVRRTDDKAYCYAAGMTVDRFACWSLGPGETTSTSITATMAEKMLRRAEYRNTTLGADLNESGFYSVNSSNAFGSETLIVDCVKEKKYTSSTREWWTTMTKVNVNTHAVERNVRTYYQRQESPWYDFMWTQKECWGVYVDQGLHLRKSQ